MDSSFDFFNDGPHLSTNACMVATDSLSLLCATMSSACVGELLWSGHASDAHMFDLVMHLGQLVKASSTSRPARRHCKAKCDLDVRNTLFACQSRHREMIQ